MRIAVIDSATINQMAQFLDGSSESAYPWSISSALALSTLVIGSDNLAIAPGVRPLVDVADDPQDRIIECLRECRIVGRMKLPSAQRRRSALQGTNRWIGRRDSIQKVQNELSKMVADTENFAKWIEFTSTKSWIPHTRRFGGLFDVEFAKYLGKILDLDEMAVIELHEMSKDEQALKAAVGRRDADFRILTRAYVASAIIRGRFHEEICGEEDSQLFRHPLRGEVAKRPTLEPVVKFEGGRTLTCLARLVLHTATKQKTLPKRIDTWVESVEIIQRYLNGSGIEFSESGSDSEAIENALLVAKKAGLRVHSKQLEDALSLGTTCGLGIIASVAVAQWAGAGVGAVMASGIIGTVAGKVAIGQDRPRKTLQQLSFALDGRRMSDVAAGRIDLSWRATK